MFEKAPDLVNLLKGYKYYAEDKIDRLNCHYTYTMLSIFVLIAAGKQTFGDAIVCLTSAETPKSWNNYYHDYCFIQAKQSFLVKDLHRVGINNGSLQRMTTQHIVYYQWVPFILIAQSALFLLPRFFWSYTSSNFCNGKDMESTVGFAVQIRKIFGDERKTSLKQLGQFVIDSFKLRKKRMLNGQLATFFYVMRKWLTFLNAAFQFVVLCYFIPDSFNPYWGFETINYKWTPDDVYLGQGFFPTVVRCQTDSASLANMHSNQVQCVIMLNFVYEKIFIIVYFWLIILMFLNTFSALRWTIFALSKTDREAMLNSLTPTQDVLFASAVSTMGVQANSVHNKMLGDYFSSKVLKSDGILLLYFVFNGAGGVVTFDLTHALWKIAVQPSFRYSSNNEERKMEETSDKSSDNDQPPGGEERHGWLLN